MEVIIFYGSSAPLKRKNLWKSESDPSRQVWMDSNAKQKTHDDEDVGPKEIHVGAGGAKQPRQHCSQFSKDVTRTLIFFFYICIYSLWKVRLLGCAIHGQIIFSAKVKPNIDIARSHEITERFHLTALNHSSAKTKHAEFSFSNDFPYVVTFKSCFDSIFCICLSLLQL